MISEKTKIKPTSFKEETFFLYSHARQIVSANGARPGMMLSNSC